MSGCDYADKTFAEKYAKGSPSQFVPGYFTMQRMAAQLIREVAGASAEVLVLGAGGGMEIAAFGECEPGWRFFGVDPSPEMLDEARKVVEDAGLSGRVQFLEGYIPEAPAGPFDAATSMLTLHFLKDDGKKLEALKAVRDRLKPNAPFILVDLCLDKTAADYDARRDRYAQFALNAGANPDDVARTRGRLKDVLNTVSAERDVELLREANFNDIELFYAGLSWRGWIARA
ncbi:MAG: class I SAM-dependent methyltransferase [Pseudomonadota bacterium]